MIVTLNWDHSAQELWITLDGEVLLAEITDQYRARNLPVDLAASVSGMGGKIYRALVWNSLS